VKRSQPSTRSRRSWIRTVSIATLTITGIGAFALMFDRVATRQTKSLMVVTQSASMCPKFVDSGDGLWRVVTAREDGISVHGSSETTFLSCEAREVGIVDRLGIGARRVLGLPPGTFTYASAPLE
jgi:hypothetical protein